MSFFEAEDLVINFGGVRALDGVSFQVEPGQVFTIIGPNGAGKTTVFNVISRIYAPTRGRLHFRGEDITRVRPHEIARRGIARTFQNIELFEHATVLQNLLLGRHTHRRSRFVEELLWLPRVRALELEHREAVEKVIDFLDLMPYRDSLIVNLPYGIRKVVEMGRALCGAGFARVTDARALCSAIQTPSPALRLVEARTERAANLAQHRMLQDAVVAALGDPP